MSIVDLHGKTALVTGGARRLGAATSLALAEAGAHIVLHYGASGREAAQIAAQVSGHGVRCALVQADLAQPDNVAGLFQRAVDAAGPVDFLINSAAIFPEAALEACTTGKLAENIQINAVAPLRLSLDFAAQGREGCIVNFLDTMVADYDRKHVPYHLSKRMLYTLTRILALECAPKVRVNAVAPGLILPPEGKDEHYLAALAHSNPLQRYGNPRAVTEAVLFLLRSAFVTGQVIFLDGGRHLRGRVYD
ncbi:MAG: SDR family oxidoreductase [Candidatus Hydrogenedentes bacterium]|nr:SDR family oxidoreductase [Candidatus Hydrogenedentota bacterium]